MTNLITKNKELLKHPLDNVDINQINVYIELNQFGKLQFEYGDFILKLALEYCEEKEWYEKCSLIKRIL